jgi:hypothetical protein
MCTLQAGFLFKIALDNEARGTVVLIQEKTLKRGSACGGDGASIGISAGVKLVAH